MRIHQFVHTLSYGDAISTEVLSLQRALRECGHESEIYCLNVHPRYKSLGKFIADFSNDGVHEVILHYSLGSPLNELYRSLGSVTRTLIYHNITPAHWFAGVNPRVAQDIRQGLEELPQLCGVSDKLLADSTFNASEIQQLGFECRVLPLPVDEARWNTGVNQGIQSLLQGDPSLHLLHVGRIAPNKRLEDILKIFYFLHHYVERQSKLWLVGIDIDTELYSYALKRLASELDITHAVFFTGGLADEEVRAFYTDSSAYICMSEHEGFCLPVLEAMKFELPVIAYHAGSLPETVGTGGIIVREKRHAELAEIVVEVHQNRSVRQQLIEAGKAQVARFTYEKFVCDVQMYFTDPKNVSEKCRITA
jgi:L-malate glycosyltransferase